ncbi:MAG: hypothetical protein OXH15_12640 [Gammaproteobacteria bacterium]|nr:hypothetical protein [Gammaproteobacteria bacterium]
MKKRLLAPLALMAATTSADPDVHGRIGDAFARKALHKTCLYPDPVYAPSLRVCGNKVASKGGVVPRSFGPTVTFAGTIYEDQGLASIFNLVVTERDGDPELRKRLNVLVHFDAIESAEAGEARYIFDVVPEYGQAAPYGPYGLVRPYFYVGIDAESHGCGFGVKHRLTWAFCDADTTQSAINTVAAGINRALQYGLDATSCRHRGVLIGTRVDGHSPVTWEMRHYDDIEVGECSDPDKH